MTFTVSAATDVGLRRPHNEDRFGCWPADAGPDADPVLLVVADGMGGAQAGEVASRLAVECIVGSHPEQRAEDALEELRRAVESANQVIYEQAVANPQLHGMGTTCTAVIVRGDEVLFAHVGDSRAYLVRAGRIRQFTEDHSLVAQLVMQRHLTPEQARTDPRRNVVTRSVGVWPAVEVDAGRLDEPLRPGDTLVLCTDGLHGVVEDEEIAAIAGGPSPERACGELIALAHARGAPDNITVLLGRRA
jgi:protein phosphatase